MICSWYTHTHTRTHSHTHGHTHTQCNWPANSNRQNCKQTLIKLYIKGATNISLCMMTRMKKKNPICSWGDKRCMRLRAFQLNGRMYSRAQSEADELGSLHHKITHPRAPSSKLRGVDSQQDCRNDWSWFYRAELWAKWQNATPCVQLVACLHQFCFRTHADMRSCPRIRLRWQHYAIINATG